MSVARRPVSKWRAYVANLAPSGRDIEIEASDTERRAIAEEYGLVDLSSFKARIRLVRTAGDGVRLEGRLAADLQQTCVVSLVPVDQRIDDEFTRLFLPEDRFAEAGTGSLVQDREVVVELTEEELPEPFDGVSLDLRAILLEQFALALDPYPRHPDAAAATQETAEVAKPEGGAFAALKDLKRRNPGVTD